MNHKKAIMAAAVFTCLYFSLERLVDFYSKFFPVAKPGECLKITFSKTQRAKIKILENNDESKSSNIERYFERPYTMHYQIQYEELRKLKPVKVSCDEKVN